MPQQGSILLPAAQLADVIGGERGIRTPDTLAGTPDFESGAFSRSASSPNLGADLLRAAARRQAGLAERVGFEPTIRCRIHAFQACAFGRSATSPITSRAWSGRTS